MNNNKQISAEVAVTPRKHPDPNSLTEIMAGESFTLDITVTNNTYMEEYGPDDIKLTNPHAAIDFYDCGDHITPRTSRWNMNLGSMVDAQTKSFSKTFTTDLDFPYNKCFFTVLSWTNENDPDTLDIEIQNFSLIKVNPSDQTPPDPDDPEDNESNGTNGHSNSSTTTENQEATYQNSSSPSDLENMNPEQLKEVKQFTLEEKDKNKIIFLDTLDFSSEESLKKLDKLKEHTDLLTLGKVMIDSEYLNMLKGDAIVIMYNLPFESTPLIYKDSHLATESEIKNISYIYSPDKKTGTLTFEVFSFSTYIAKLEELVPERIEHKEILGNPLSKTLTIIVIVTLQGMLIAIITKLVLKNKEKKENVQNPIQSSN